MWVLGNFWHFFYNTYVSAILHWRALGLAWTKSETVRQWSTLLIWKFTKDSRKKISDGVLFLQMYCPSNCNYPWNFFDFFKNSLLKGVSHKEFVARGSAKSKQLWTEEGWSVKCVWIEQEKIYIFILYFYLEIISVKRKLDTGIYCTR